MLDISYGMWYDDGMMRGKEVISLCELNPKRAAVFRLEFYTSADIDEERWLNLIIGRLLKLEEIFNASGEVRVHIHETEGR